MIEYLLVGPNVPSASPDTGVFPEVYLEEGEPTHFTVARERMEAIGVIGNPLRVLVKSLFVVGAYKRFTKDRQL